MNERIAIGKIQQLGFRRMNQRTVSRKADVEVKGYLAKPAQQLGKGDKVLLQMRILGRANCVENADEIGLLVGKADMPVANV